MAERQAPPKVRVLFAQAPQYRNATVTGCWGGVVASGLIHVSFWNEHVADPKELMRDQEKGTEEVLKGSGSVSDEVNVTRTLEFGAYIQPAVARSIARWLISQAETLEARQKPEP